MEEQDSRREIYDIFAAQDLDFETKVTRALDVGSDFLSLPIGFFTRIDDGIQRIVQSRGDHPLLQPGETCPLDQAYCRRTVEIDSPLAVHDVTSSASISETAIDTFDLGTYIGAKIQAGDEIYGTVCFAASDSRTEAFDDAEIHLVELLAKLIGNAIERRRYEQELEDREEELDERREIYRAAIEANFDIIFRIDTRGKFIYISPSVESLLGSPPEDYIGEHFDVILPDEQTSTLANDLFEDVLSGESVEEFYIPLTQRVGGHVFVDIRAVPIYDPDIPVTECTPEDVIGVLGMARDASDRRRREQAIHVLNRVLRHNLRNDMTVIRGYAELLRDQSSEEVTRYATQIVEKSDQLLALGETARRMERTFLTQSEVARIDIVPLLQEVRQEVAAQYPEATVTISVPDTLLAEATLDLRVAVRELLENAAAHSGETPTIDLTAVAEEDQAIVRITDDGPGLPEQERAVLESGEETPLVHGSGLGLWLVHWIIKGFNGDISVPDSENGTRIAIWLPR